MEAPEAFPSDTALDDALRLTPERDQWTEADQRHFDAFRTPTASAALDLVDPSTQEALTRAREDRPPQTVEERLAGLPQWQARYVLALMECHGVPALAARKCNVSVASVEDHQTRSIDFAKACAEAVNHSTDLLEAAGMRGATIGDLQPIYQQGNLVGYKRVRNPKDLELMLRVRGRLKEESKLTVTHHGRVEVSDPAGVAARIRQFGSAVFGRQPGHIIDAETGKSLPE